VTTLDQDHALGLTRLAFLMLRAPAGLSAPGSLFISPDGTELVATVRTTARTGRQSAHDSRALLLAALSVGHLAISRVHGRLA
jgi:hypothetical protein